MYYFNQNTRINLEWKVMKGVGGEAEDFSGANVWLFLYGRHRVIPVSANGMTGESKVCAVIPEGLPEDVYSMQLVWTKNECRGAGNCLVRSSKEDVFSIAAGASGPVGEPTISITTTATTYGYDGLSSYELAVMLGKTTLDRDSWVENAAEANANVQALREEVTAFFNLNDRVQALEDEVFGGNIAETTTVPESAQTIEVGDRTRCWVAPNVVFSVPAGKTITCEGNTASQTFPLLYALVDGEYILVAQGDEQQSVSWTNIGPEPKDVYAGSGYNKGNVEVTVNRNTASLAERIEAAKTEAEQEASSALAQEASLRQGADNLLQTLINGKVIDNPESGFQEHDKTVSGYALKAYLDTTFAAEENARSAGDSALGQRIVQEAQRATYAEHQLDSRASAIESKIPAQATAGNQLADKNFVNSSIATATATFQGTYNVVTDLSLSAAATHAQIELALKTRLPNVDKNDYCFVQIPTTTEVPTQIAVVERYKYNGSEWGYEWSLNNSSFTAAQWAAINSGITEGKKEIYDAHIADTDIHVTAANKSAWNAKYNKPSGGIPKSDLAGAVQASLDKADTALQPVYAPVALPISGLTLPLEPDSETSGTVTGLNVADWLLYSEYKQIVGNITTGGDYVGRYKLGVLSKTSSIITLALIADDGTVIIDGGSEEFDVVDEISIVYTIGTDTITIVTPAADVYVEAIELYRNPIDWADKQYIDGIAATKANKDEMSITDGTGADADKATIQLKSGLFKQVLKSHIPQDDAPTENGTNNVKSGGVWSAIQNVKGNELLVIAEALNSLYADYIGLAKMLATNLGETKAECIDFRYMPKVCGQPLVIEGEGAPSVLPYFVGQRYHDTTNKKCYEAFAVTGATSDWTLLN